VYVLNATGSELMSIGGSTLHAANFNAFCSTETSTPNRSVFHFLHYFEEESKFDR